LLTTLASLDYPQFLKARGDVIYLHQGVIAVHAKAAPEEDANIFLHPLVF
jgi:hypothetical protein